MKTPKQSRREAKLLFRNCLVNGLLDEPRVRETVKRVLDLKPRGYLAMLSHFQRLLKLELDRRQATIESATALAPELKTRIQGDLAQRYGAGLNVTFAQNPALLGGMRIKVGSDVYDGSVHARLSALEQSF